jgi:hypothetical protein
MEYDKKHRPELCAAKEDTRYAIKDVLLETTGEHSPCLAATDGRRLVVVPVSMATADNLEGDDDAGLIPREAFPAARKGRKTDPARIVANGDVRVLVGDTVTTFPRVPPEDRSRFPDWRQVLPERGPDRMRVRFTADILIGLLKAIGTEYVEFEFRPDGTDAIIADGPIRVNGEGDNGEAFGVIMPVSGV